MGKVVVVTGASAGVGRATARAFGERGDAVALLARGRDGLDAAAKEIEAAGGRAFALPTEVADPAAVEDAASRVEAELGPIDVWVNNAMVSVFALFTDIAPEEFRRVTDVTYHGYVNGTRAALARMLPRDRGVIVQVGSALAYRGIPAQSAYCGAKHAIEGFTESIRCELLHYHSEVRMASCSCRRSTRRSSTACCPACPAGPSPSLPSTSPRSSPEPSSTWPTGPGERCG